jgi:hypothetical protein
MSVELHVLFGGKVPSKGALTRAMKELGFPVTIPAGGKPLAQQGGYLPMKLRREESGVEVDVSADRAVVEEIAGKHFDPRYERCVSLRWGGDEQEMLCALCTAAALAKLTDGIVLDDDGRPLSAEQAVAQARGSLSRVKPAEPRYGTRPADIKRYLKPLLELRSDLVVVGRHLLIRPVRHLLRGARFWRTGDKYRFQITADVHPLFGYACGSDMSAVGVPTEVWQPHFAAQLFDALKTDIFDRWGPVTTLDGFATELINKGDAYYSTPVMCFALAGEWDRAAEWAERAQRELTETEEARTEKARIGELWAELTTDADAVCAKLHAQEAETVKALKLERIWEPSPFPVELPAAERTRSADPLFLTTPWIPTPPGLRQELPKEPGEVRFAKNRVGRGDDLILPVALAREEAEERHRQGEDYVLTVRLPDGLLLMIAYFWHWDRHKPQDFPFERTPRAPSYVIELHGTSRWVLILASSRLYDENIIELNSISVYDRCPFPHRWYCYVHLRDGDKRVYDWRSGEKVFTETALTDEERALATCAVLPFGEYAEVEARARALLRALGYDETIC